MDNEAKKIAIDGVCDAYEAAWKKGDGVPELGEFLPMLPEGYRAELLVELLLLDRFYRKSRGIELEPEVYKSRFPNFHAQIQRAFTVPADGPATIGFSPETVTPENDGGSASFALGQSERVPYFGDYEIVSEIARGGMGVVYRARQISLNRIIALKMILSGQIADPEQIRRFQLEAEAAARLDHPGIVPIYDIGEHNGQHYFSMKLIEGKTLSQLTDELRPDRRRSVELVAKIADAIHHAHQRGILHRDLKPGNVLLDTDGQPMVMDFGLARNTQNDHGLTQTGAIVGTPGFMSPEQAAGEMVTTATDIYSLGAILYQLVCGRPPHQEDTVMKTVMSVMHDEPPKPSSVTPEIEKDLELILLKCLTKSPNQRYSSAAALASDLRAFLSNEPISVRSPSLFELTRLWLGKNYGNILWIPVIATLIGVLAGFSIWVSTFGQDISLKVSTYAKFPEADRPFLVRDWKTVGIAASVLFLLLVSMLGWLTAKLVRTKNRAADLGAGLSVGILSGLVAFVSGMGAVMLESVRVRGQLDQELLFQLAVVDDPSYAQERIVTHYPTLEAFTPIERAWLLNEKRIGDQWSTAVTGIAVGTFVVLFFFGLSGLTQTLVAGPLLREKSLWRGLFSYSCFSISLVLLYFTLAGPTSMYFLLGSFAVFNWAWPLLSTLLAITAIAAVVYRWHWALQLMTFLSACAGFTAAIVYEWSNSAPPQVAQRQTELRQATRLSESNPERRDFAIRRVRAHLSYAILLGRFGRSQLAYEQYKAAVDQIEKGKSPDLFNSQERVLYAQILYEAGVQSLQMKKHEDAARYLAKHSRLFQSTSELMDLYAQTVLQTDKPIGDYLRDTSASNSYTWWRFGNQIRSIAVQKELGGPSASTWYDEQIEEALKQCKDSSIVDRWDDRKQRLRNWLRSKHRWEIFGPSTVSNGQTYQEVLDRELPIEKKLIANPETVTPDKSIEQWVGSKVDLVRELGDATNVVCYARTRFTLDEPAKIRFRFGSDDSFKVWIDGEMITQYAGLRSVTEGNDEIRLEKPLSAGEHSMVLKVFQAEGGWGFVVDAADEEGWPLPLWYQPSDQELSQ